MTDLRIPLIFIKCPVTVDKTQATRFWPCGLLFLVEISGIEPLTSCMPCRRSPEVSGMHPHKAYPHKYGYLLSCREFI